MNNENKPKIVITLRNSTEKNIKYLIDNKNIVKYHYFISK